MLFSIVKNEKIFEQLYSELKKSKFLKFKKDIGYEKLIKSDYNLLINNDLNHEITKKFFKKFKKNYNSVAFYY